MILIVTNKKDYTADFVIVELNRRGIPYIRFNTEDFPQYYSITWTTSKAIIKTQKQRSLHINFDDVDSVWYRKPIYSVPDPNLLDDDKEFVIRESDEMLKGMWKCLEANWVNEPEKNDNASNKLHQLVLAKKIGFSIPETIVTNNANDLIDFTKTHKCTIIKPIHSGLVNEDEHRVVFTNKLESTGQEKYKDIIYCPSIIQNYIEKDIDIRVNIFGNKVFSTAIHSQRVPEATCDWRRANILSIPHEDYKLPSKIENLCLKMLESYGLKFGAFDLIKTKKGEYIFIELNPNGQWAWIEHLTNQPLRHTLIELLTSKGR